MKCLKLVILLVLFVSFKINAETRSAEQLFEEALKRNQSGLLIEASVLLTQAIAKDNQQARFFYQRGLSFFGMNQITHGIKDFKSAVDLKSTELNAYLTLIRHYMEHSKYLMVLELTDQLIVSFPDQAAGAYYDKAKAYEKMKKPSLAIKAYQSASENLDSDQSDFKETINEAIKILGEQKNN